MKKEKADVQKYLAPECESITTLAESVLCISGKATTPTFDPEEEFEM